MEGFIPYVAPRAKLTSFRKVSSLLTELKMEVSNFCSMGISHLIEVDLPGFISFIWRTSLNLSITAVTKARSSPERIDKVSMLELWNGGK